MNQPSELETIILDVLDENPAGLAHEKLSRQAKARARVNQGAINIALKRMEENNQFRKHDDGRYQRVAPAAEGGEVAQGDERLGMSVPVFGKDEETIATVARKHTNKLLPASAAMGPVPADKIHAEAVTGYRITINGIDAGLFRRCGGAQSFPVMENAEGETLTLSPEPSPFLAGYTLSGALSGVIVDASPGIRKILGV